VLSRKHQLKILEINTLPGMTKPGLPPQPAFADILNLRPEEREIFEQLVLPHGSCLARFLHTKHEQREARGLPEPPHDAKIYTLPAGTRAGEPTAGKRDAATDPSTTLLEQAIAAQAEFLLRASLADGSFNPQENPRRKDREGHRYEVLRQAGAIIALDLYDRWRPDARVRHVALRAGEYLKTKYLAPIPGEPGLLAIWSRSEFNVLGVPDQVKLGWVGLGLMALLCLERHSPGFTPLEELRALGEFLRWSQHTDGRFRCLFETSQGGWNKGWKSLDYPGQAVLALLELHRLDPSPKWLQSATDGLACLALERRGRADIRADYWALLATARLLPVFVEGSFGVGRGDLVGHARQICERILGEQLRRSTRPELNGGFDPNGRTEPTSRRLPGLLAACSFMAHEDPHFDQWLRAATRDGIDFLVRASAGGGMVPGPMTRSIQPAADESSGVPRSANRRAGDVHIDYVQPALFALLRYALLLDDADTRFDASKA